MWRQDDIVMSLEAAASDATAAGAHGKRARGG